MLESRSVREEARYVTPPSLLTTDVLLSEPDEPLLELAPGPDLETAPPPAKPEPVTVSISEDTDNKPTATHSFLFASLEESDSADSDSDIDHSASKQNELWASLMLQLDNLRIDAGGQKKGKKGKSSGVILETTEMRNLKDRITKVEKEYMFSRKDAGMLQAEASAHSQM